MVDYNLQVPGIAPAQNAMQINPMQIIPLMQQQQLNNMLMQERARELQETGVVRNVMAEPGFNPYTPEGRQRLIAAAPTKLGPALSKAFADIGLTQRQEQEASVRIATAVQKMGIEKFDALGGRLAAVDPADPATYNAWFKEAAPNMPGVKLPTPQEWERATPEQRLAAQRRLLTDGATIRTQILKDAEEANKPVSGNWVTTSTGERVFEPSAVRPGQIPAITPGVRAPVGAPMGAQPRAAAAFNDNPAAGVPSYPVPPNRMADINRRAAMFGAGIPSALSAPSTPEQMAMVQRTPAAQAAFEEAPRVTAPASGKMTNRVEPLGGFMPATGMTEMEKAAAQAYGTAKGQTLAKTQEEERKADLQLTQAVNEVEAAIKKGGLLDKSTGSLIGNAIDNVFGTIGVSTPGAQAAAKLRPISDLALKMVPRFEGAQSNTDRQSYEQAAGDLANPNLPIETRRAAGQTVARLMRDRAGQFETRTSALTTGERKPGAGAAGGPVSVQVPGGRVFSFPDQAAADKFRREAGL